MVRTDANGRNRYNLGSSLLEDDDPSQQQQPNVGRVRSSTTAFLSSLSGKLRSDRTGGSSSNHERNEGSWTGSKKVVTNDAFNAVRIVVLHTIHCITNYEMLPPDSRMGKFNFVIVLLLLIVIDTAPDVIYYMSSIV
jgi:hypothetical protein